MKELLRRLLLMEKVPQGPVVLQISGESEPFFCVFLGKNPREMMIYEGAEGWLSYEGLKMANEDSPEGFTAFYRQKGIQITVGASGIRAISWQPGRIPEPLEEYSMLIPFLEAILDSIQSPQEVAIKPQAPAYGYGNQLKLHRIKKLPQKPVAWEALQFFSSPKVWDQGLKSELLGAVTLMVAPGDNRLVFQDITPAKAENLSQIPDKLADNFLERGYFPKSLVVGDLYLQGILLDFCFQLGIGCVVGPVQTAQNFRNELVGYLPVCGALGS
ncbi:MAG: hypothetical protein FWF59_08230 [Turicibacter sp.]|nr:hypothetical protein [Turicibacter sp.]